MRTLLGNSKSWNVDHTYDDPYEIEGKAPYDDDISTISGKSDPPPPYSNDPSKLLMESAEEKKLRRRSHWVAYATMFVMTVGFSVVLSGVWPYLQNLEPDLEKQSLGWVVAANPFGQMIASPIVGFLGNKFGSIRYVCYFTMTFFILGNLMYSFLPLTQGWWTHSSYHLMIISRFIVGVSSSNVTLCRSYLASSTTVKERTTGIAIISAAQSLGFVLGPAIQTVLSLAIDKDILKYRSTGWVAAILGVINFVLLTPMIFQEYNISSKERAIMKGRGNNNKEKQFIIPKIDYVALFGVLFGFFMNQFIYVLMETLMEPFLTDQYSWCNDIAVVVVGVAFTFAGFLAIAMFITATRLAKRYDERKILIFCAFVPITIGVFLFIPWGPEKLTYCSNSTDSETLFLSGTMSNHYTIKSNSIANLNDPNSLIQNDTSSNPFNFLAGVMLNYDDYTGVDPQKSGGKQWCKNNTCYGCPSEQTWCDGYDKLPMVQFFVAFIIVVSGYPYGVAMSNAIFSKILGPRPQGTWMGVLTASGSFARVLGPIFVSYLYANQGTRITFGVLFVGMLVAISELSILFKRIVPMKVKTEEKNKY